MTKKKAPVGKLQLKKKALLTLQSKDMEAVYGGKVYADGGASDNCGASAGCANDVVAPPTSGGGDCQTIKVTLLPTGNCKSG